MSQTEEGCYFRVGGRAGRPGFLRELVDGVVEVTGVRFI